MLRRTRTSPRGSLIRRRSQPLPRWPEPALLAAILVFGALPLLGFQVLGRCSVIFAGLALVSTIALIVVARGRGEDG
ncbi:MAG: hypothetical protein HY320_10660 [Armatimonadetes bacterium]|nr:hypothetical protein [Armatimonadota bacterium]